MMRCDPRILAALVTAATWSACSTGPRYSVRQGPVEINGRKVVSFDESGGPVDAPRIVGADVIPGRGMNIYQMRAWFPGKGIVNVLVSPPIEEGRALLNLGPGDEYGNRSYRFGAILAPFANRIRGRLLPDGNTIETNIGDRKVRLLANSRGREGDVEPHAMHGLILARATDSLVASSTGNEARATGVIEAGDFQGHWPSSTRLEITARLAGGSFSFTVTALNTGAEDVPIGVGWHPYFVFPSGRREQVRLHVPARQRALVTNYNEVFPTGEAAPVGGTPYDFSAPGGAPLNQLFLDDCFLDLNKDSSGQAVGEIVDPAAGYGVRIRAISPEISAFQVYAPPDRSVVAFEPQFNLADPFNSTWKDRNTGMVMLKPGRSVAYSVRVEVFVP